MQDSAHTLTVERIREWDRQPLETDKAWNAFQIYLDLPKPRKYAEVAEKLGIHKQGVAKWGAKYDWVIRSGAFDNAQIGVLSAGERDETLGMFQIAVIAEAHDDYNRMRSLWTNLVEKAEASLSDTENPVKASDVKGLIQARNQLDIMARRTARMPLTFAATEEDGLKEIEKKQFYLDEKNGPQEVEFVEASG